MWLSGFLILTGRHPYSCNSLTLTVPCRSTPSPIDSQTYWSIHGGCNYSRSTPQHSHMLQSFSPDHYFPWGWFLHSNVGMVFVGYRRPALITNGCLNDDVKGALTDSVFLRKEILQVTFHFPFNSLTMVYKVQRYNTPLDTDPCSLMTVNSSS